MNICESVKKRYIRLSKGQRKVAQFVVDNPNIIASQIASEVGRLAGVSESTVIRFCYAMDLSGFSELQEKMKAYLIESGELPIVKQRAPKKKQAADSVAKVIGDVTASIAAVDGAAIEQTAQVIGESKSVYVIGFRQAVPAALWFYNELTLQRDHVYFIQHDAEDIARSLATMDETSVLVTFMFDEKFEDDETVLAIAQRRNVNIVALCNQLPCKCEQGIIQLCTEKLMSEGIPNKIALFTILYTLIERVEKQAKQAKVSAKNKVSI